MIPRELHKYFWEVDPKTIDPKGHSRYIIERLLEYADIEGVKWMMHTYSKGEISGVLKNSRTLSKISANHWALVLGVSKSEILCLSKQFQKTSRAIWKY